MSPFNPEQRRQSEVHTLREFNTEYALLIREQYPLRRAERRAEVIPEEGIQAREMNATFHRASSMLRTLRYVDREIGGLEAFQAQVHHHQLHPAECASFAKLLNGEIKQQTFAGVAQKLCLHRQMIPLKISNRFVLVKVRSHKSVFSFTSTGASLMKNARIFEQMAKARKGVQTFHVQGTICHRVLHCSAQLYVFDNDLEVQINT